MKFETIGMLERAALLLLTLSWAGGCQNDAPTLASTLGAAGTIATAGTAAPAAAGTGALAGGSAAAAGSSATVAGAGAATTVAGTGAAGGPALPTPGVAAPGNIAPAPETMALLERAKGLFQPLPASMDSPTRPVTPEKITLGRQLYYEKRLSKAQTMSCNSCHDLSAYGTDSRAGATGQFSEGHKGQLGGRNSPTSYNAALHIAQFWDGRAADVEEQAKGPVLNPVEMALADEATAVAVLKSIPDYAALFAAAFPGEADPITFTNMAIAIGAFERKLITRDRFDKFLGGDMAALSAVEQQGLATFMDSGCTTCHAGAGIGGAMYQKLGLQKPFTTTDQGRFDVTKAEPDRYVFKVPSLRNIEKTAPYFHDGSQATLTAAVTTMAEYQTPNGKLTDPEVVSIVAFLASLTGELPLEYIKEPAALAGGPTTPMPDPN